MDPATVTASGIAIAIAITCAACAAWWYRYRARRAEAAVATLERQLRAAHQAALHDPLTGLPNRRAFGQRGAALLANPTHQPFVAIVVDLDNFKHVNDTLGHAVGDQVLVTLGRRLAAYAAGNLVARLDGDEFALLAKGSTGRAVYPDPGELAAMLAAPMRIAGHNVQVTASIGVAIARPPSDLTDIIRQADIAMYRAKYLRRYDTYTYPAVNHDHRHHPVIAIRAHPTATERIWAPIPAIDSLPTTLVPNPPPQEGHRHART